MPINNSYDEAAIVEAIATALDNFYTNLIKKVDSLNVKTVMKRKNPYLFRAKAMNGAAQIIDAILAAFVSSSEETIFGNVFFEPIATAAAQGQKALAEGVDIMVERDNTIYAIAVKSGTSVFNADSRKKQEQNFMATSKLAQQAKKRFVPIVGYGYLAPPCLRAQLRRGQGSGQRISCSWVFPSAKGFCPSIMVRFRVSLNKSYFTATTKVMPGIPSSVSLVETPSTMPSGTTPR